MNVPHAGGRPRKRGGCGATKHCVYGACNSDSRKNCIDYTFHSFPKACLKVRQKYITPDSEHLTDCNECQKCMLWISKCGRVDGRFEKLEHVKRYTYICSKHFVIKELFDQYPYPLPEESVKTLNANYRKRPLVTASTKTDDYVTDFMSTTNQDFKRRKIDSSTLFNADDDVISNDDDSRMTDLANEKEIEVFATQTESIKVNMCETLTQTESPVKLCSKGTQTTSKRYDYNKLEEELVQVKTQNRMLENDLKKKTNSLSDFEKRLQSNDKMCKFYTNLNYVQILHLLSFLKPPNELGDNKMKKLTNQQQLLMTLVRLRTGLLIKEMSYLFELSEGLLSKIVSTWVQFMYNKFDSVKPYMFPSRNKIKELLPEVFTNLKNIRIIIDCVQFFCQAPSNFEQQSYTTFKVLLGCTPNGAISFVSDLYEGSISDRELVKESKLLDLVEEGDLVLADRGFAIKDFTDEKEVFLNIPPFRKRRETFTVDEEIETKRIEETRICVEHIVGRLKQFRLLKKILPFNMKSLLSQIVFVCACLVNFQKPLLLPSNRHNRHNN